MATGCPAQNQDGDPCSAHIYRDGWCRWHHPDLEAERRAWSARGGANRSNKARARKTLPDDVLSVNDLRGVIGRTIRRVLGGEIEPGVANAIANLSRVALAAAEQSALADLQERIAELEALTATGSA
jgi:hypothetical protein